MATLFPVPDQHAWVTKHAQNLAQNAGRTQPSSRDWEQAMREWGQPEPGAPEPDDHPTYP